MTPSSLETAAPRSGWWARFRQLRKTRALAARGFDLRLLRFPVMITALLAALLPFDFHAVTTIAATIAFPLFAFLVCVYFGHILMRRLQCSLLEFGLLIIIFGNAAGIVLTSSGVFALGWNWMLTLGLLLTAWILYGAVRGMTQARLLGVSAGMQIIYNYTFVKREPEQEELDSLQPTITTNVKSNASVRELLDKGIKMTYCFHDEQGKVLKQFDVAK